jgi:hypothetical protein
MLARTAARALSTSSRLFSSSASRNSKVAILPSHIYSNVQSTMPPRVKIATEQLNEFFKSAVKDQGNAETAILYLKSKYDFNLNELNIRNQGNVSFCLIVFV